MKNMPIKCLKFYGNLLTALTIIIIIKRPNASPSAPLTDPKTPSVSKEFRSVLHLLYRQGEQILRKFISN